MDEVEKFFTCPYCQEQISMLIDLSAGPQTYIEDCEVCCRPIQISYQINAGRPQHFHADRTL